MSMASPYTDTHEQNSKEDVADIRENMIEVAQWSKGMRTPEVVITQVLVSCYIQHLFVCVLLSVSFFLSINISPKNFHNKQYQHFSHLSLLYINKFLQSVGIKKIYILICIPKPSHLGEKKKKKKKNAFTKQIKTFWSTVYIVHTSTSLSILFNLLSLSQGRTQMSNTIRQ